MTRARQAEKMPVPALWMNPGVGMKFECSLTGSRSNRPPRVVRRKTNSRG
jgi:hypothetical protein